MKLRVAGWVPVTSAEGPHRRFAVWTQGCALACPGCCNPELFDPNGGREITVAELLRHIDAVRAEIEGITVVGGEPLEQIAAVTALAEGCRARGLGVLVFTGHRRADVERWPGYAALWTAIDTLVDGRFDAASARGEMRRFVGSPNQVLHHRTERYRSADLWHGEALAELVLDDRGHARLVGTPSLVRLAGRALTAQSSGLDDDSTDANGRQVCTSGGLCYSEPHMLDSQTDVPTEPSTNEEARDSRAGQSARFRLRLDAMGRLIPEIIVEGDNNKPG